MYIRTYIHTCIPAYIHTYIPTYLRTYVHTYIHVYMYTCIHVLVLGVMCFQGRETMLQDQDCHCVPEVVNSAWTLHTILGFSLKNILKQCFWVMCHRLTVMLDSKVLGAAEVADRLGHYHSNLLYIRAREERMRWQGIWAQDFPTCLG